MRASDCSGVEIEGRLLNVSRMVHLKIFYPWVDDDTTIWQEMSLKFEDRNQCIWPYNARCHILLLVGNYVCCTLCEVMLYTFPEVIEMKIQSVDMHVVLWWHGA